MQPVPQPRVTISLQIENERFLEQLFRDCKEQLGMDHGITIDVFFVLFDLLISMCARARACVATRENCHTLRMYRLDKIDSHLQLVLPAIERFGAAVGDDTGAKCHATFRKPAVHGFS